MFEGRVKTGSRDRAQVALAQARLRAESDRGKIDDVPMQHRTHVTRNWQLSPFERTDRAPQELQRLGLRRQSPRHRAVEADAAGGGLGVRNHLDDELEVLIRTDVASLADMQQRGVAASEPNLMPAL